MSTITAIPTTTRIAILKHAINGKADNFIAGATGLTPAQVLDVKAAHGYPDLDKMDWAVDVLTKQVEARPAPSAPVVPSFKPKPSTAPRFTPTDKTQRPAAPQPTVVEHREPTMSANELIVAASRSPKKRTQALGVKISALLDRLATDLAAETAAAKAAAAAKEADRERLDRIAKLEAELRKLKGQKPGKGSAAAAAPDGDHECGECDRSFRTVQALRMHERRAHQGFNPQAVHAERESA